MNQSTSHINVSEILIKKKEAIEKWEILQEHILQMMEEAMHWRNSAEDYDVLVRNYYLQRQKHQKEVMRLNQILYGPHHPQLGVPCDMSMRDGFSNHGECSAFQIKGEHNNNCAMIIDDDISNSNGNNNNSNNVFTAHVHNINHSRKRKSHLQQGLQVSEPSKSMMGKKVHR